MIIRPWAEFTSDLPDDQIEDETDFVQLGGKNVIEAIGGLLQGFGCKISPAISAGDNGWEMNVEYRGRSLWCQVTRIEGFIFIFEETSWLNKILKRHNPAYIRALSQLADALAADPRFHNVSWYFDSDLLSGEPGAPRPVSDGKNGKSRP